jgi:predicted nucleotidyltransferase component of viral defense system
MLTLDEISTFYPGDLHRFPRFLMREYLQHKILEIVYESSFATGLYFMGGTCLRLLHGNRRFSEDLDFDNRSLTEADFDVLAAHIGKELGRLGFESELKVVKRGAWHCYIRIPEWLYKEGISGYRNEKILIQLDTEPQNFDYHPDRILLNRFEVFTAILSTPATILMAQKFYALLNRPRSKGRDLYDLIFLMGKRVKPDFSYLYEKCSIMDASSLKQRVLTFCLKLDMKSVAQDVDPFLFDGTDIRKIGQFSELVEQYDFN